MKVQSIQPTPNPNAFKFVVDEVLYLGTKNYSTAADTSGHELAEQLFAIDGVETLFFCDRFVTLSMTTEADWRAVHEQATRVLEAAPAQTDVAAAPPGAPDAEDAPSATATSDADREVLERINAVLDDRVRPALAGDGGGLEVLGLEGKTLSIRYQGACGSCPSSIAGTLMAIQNLLQSEVDAELAVVPA